MTFELHALSLQELKKLQKRVEDAIASFESRKKLEALAAIDAAARDMGFLLQDLVFGKRKRKPAEVRYANPADRSQTWSGRGRRPRWFAAALEAGKSADDLRI